jgi:hypothetical protein
MSRIKIEKTFMILVAGYPQRGVTVPYISKKVGRDHDMGLISGFAVSRGRRGK